MAARSIGLSLAVTAIIFFVSLLRPAYAEVQVALHQEPQDAPLSPLELRFELNDAGSPDLSRKVDKRAAAPNEQNNATEGHHMYKRQYSTGSGTPYWYSQIKRQGSPAYGNNATYKIWRNVKDYGARGDGVTDDTDAIQAAIADGFRCGFWGTAEATEDPRNCESQTTTPAIVYVPAGTYMISKPVVMWYYTHFIGDANNLPTLKATSGFSGIGVLDTDPYIIYQQQWYTNQNNFWRNVRNLIIDTTNVPSGTSVHGVHWQVSQATTMQNVVFVMPIGGDNPQHLGIFMDNGSSLFLEDLIFIGGQYGLFAGNQQYNMRNLTFYNCDTGIFQNWGWSWSYKSLTFNQCRVGFDMTQGGDGEPAVGGIQITDSTFNDCDIGILALSPTNVTAKTGLGTGTLGLDNVDFVNTDPAIAYPNGTVIWAGNQLIEAYAQGAAYTVYDSDQEVGSETCYRPAANVSRIQRTFNAPPKSPSLIDSNGRYYERSKPQYEGVPVSQFKSIMDFGCPNDGVTDATDCVQRFFNSLTADQIGFIDHGAYVITDTVTIPNNVKLQGEVWPLFMVTGPNFQDEFAPIVAFRVGQPGDVGTTELVEILFETIGPVPGCIMMEWNLAGAYPGAAGMWDTHWRIGGSNGTELQLTQCMKNQRVAHGASKQCWGAFMNVHFTRTAKNVMISHSWIWIADHELDLPGQSQIDIYNGRGILIESEGPMWFYGSGSEHSMLYNYQFAGASNIYFSIMQSETAYMQTNPNALASFTAQPGPPWNDPTFDDCFLGNCIKTQAVRVFNSTYLYLYGLGLYSFFQNYDSACIITTNCDQFRVYIEQSQGIYLYGYTSVAAEYMAYVDGVALVPSRPNFATFGNTVALLEYP
ncbi:hypothetical protein AC579_2363 [Pseudocercospora musae]|uniref:Rhamnogalacturonase A/B/Epimerase-like pectate lyase domain-containing protein n=1 Tax=Pseudocercospora musae TaxID=113226 RepID=A0A139I700_9PEZI|nr:hypothetical protein AC579_2363 [Pseudocercospora musae]